MGAMVLSHQEIETCVWLIIRSRRKFPVCSVEKGLVSEDLGHCQNDAEQQHNNLERRRAFLVLNIPPVRQTGVNRQGRRFENEQRNETDEMAPKQTGNLGLDRWASEFVTRDITATSTTGRRERKEQYEKGVEDQRRQL